MAQMSVWPNQDQCIRWVTSLHTWVHGAQWSLHEDWTWPHRLLSKSRVRAGLREIWDAAAANVAKAPQQSSATSTPLGEPRAAQKVTVESQGVAAVTLCTGIVVETTGRKKGVGPSGDLCLERTLVPVGVLVSRERVLGLVPIVRL